MTSIHVVMSYFDEGTQVFLSYADAVLVTTSDDYKYMRTINSLGVDADTNSAYVVSIEGAYYDPIAAFSTKDDAELFIALSELDDSTCAIRRFSIS